MKLNFWQWLGVLLLVIGAAVFVYERFIADQPVPAETTQAQ